ncbi:MAG: DUF1631 domain-containing protein [Pseudomonadota bacterium]
MAVLPDSLDSVRKEAVDTLRSRLGALCDEADDKFFDLSQNAPPEEQSLYFEAMRELRVRRSAIVDGMCAATDRDFSALAGGDAAAGKPDSLTAAPDGLSLLDDDELDVSVAFQGMVARARDAAGNDLDHLRQRIGKVLQRGELDPERLPLHPARICEHFRSLVDGTAISLKGRLILYKFFERTVLESLRDMVAQANQTLIQAGILPEIKSARPRPTPSPDRSRAKGDADKAPPTRPAPAPSEPGGALSELLALARQALGVQGVHGGALPGGIPGMTAMPGQHAPVVAWQERPGGQLPVMIDGKLVAGGMFLQSDVPVHVIAPFELTELLTRLQQLQPAALPPPGQIIEHAELVDVKGGISELIDEAATTSPQAISGADDDLISVVSMLFDLILEDREIPPELKVLIGRLQIPMLKVALLDRNLFSMQEHPARLLLNAMAKAGTGWTKESDDGLYQRISDAIYSVLNEFIDDLGFFERLWHDFSAFVAEREKRMALIETRLRDREEGQARSEDAQQQVRAAITAMLGGRSLPDEVLTFVQECWQPVLYMTALREGVGSATWQQRSKALEVLVWCAQKPDKPDALTRQRALVPRLLISLRRGLDAAGNSVHGADARLDGLQAVLQRLGEGAEQHTVRVVTEVQPEAPKAIGDAPKPPTRPTDAVQVVRRSEDEVVIMAPPSPPDGNPPTDERWLQLADNLAPGTWIEFVEHDFKVRAKIAARIRVQNKYVFVNGRGVKIAEKTVTQLALDFEQGVARMVSDAALFDRALEGMIARLKTGQVAG